MSSIKSRISYDKKYDVLYFTLEENNNSYGDEIADNVVVMRDIDTEEVTGITIIGFLKSYRENSEKLKAIDQYFSIDDVAAKCKK